MLRAALNVHRVLRAPSMDEHAELGVSASLEQSPLLSKLKLTRVAMKENDLCAKPFAVLGSALRDGCPVVEELLSSFAVDVYHSAEVKQECWRWLAFGLFSLRLKRFASGHRLRKLGPIQCTLQAMATIVNTAGDEAKSEEESVGGELMVCTVKNGAPLEIVKRGSSTSSERIPMICDERTELEILYEDPTDGSVCVVVPGVGLGWVRHDGVERIEREPVEQSTAQLNGKYDVKLVYTESQETQPVFRRFMEKIDRHLRRIDCANCRFFDVTLQFILSSCPHLEHLNLQSCVFATADADALLAAMDGDLGSRLLSLNLNRLLIGNAFVQRLATILSGEEGNAPVLRELRLNATNINAQAITSLHSALIVNRTLRSLELKETSNALRSYEGQRFRHSFHRQLLQYSVPRAWKSAFLSVVVADRRENVGNKNKPSARDELDKWLLTLIFQFAAIEVRRVIYLHGTIRASGRHS